MDTTLAVHPVDLSPFRHGDAGERRAVARQLDDACRDTGFLLLTGHGVPFELQQRVLEVYGAFFDLPLEQKLRAVDDVPSDNRGYTALGACNIGDLLARWTNDRWTSTLHRVVPPPAREEGEVRRRSVARFLDGEPDMVIECIPSCRSEDRPVRYPPVIAGEWLRARIVGSTTQREAVLPTG